MVFVLVRAMKTLATINDITNVSEVRNDRWPSYSFLKRIEMNLDVIIK